MRNMYYQAISVTLILVLWFIYYQYCSCETDWSTLVLSMIYRLTLVLSMIDYHHWSWANLWLIVWATLVPWKTNTGAIYDWSILVLWKINTGAIYIFDCTGAMYDWLINIYAITRTLTGNGVRSLCCSRRTDAVACTGADQWRHTLLTGVSASCCEQRVVSHL